MRRGVAGREPVRGLNKRQVAQALFRVGHAPGAAELLSVVIDDASLAAYCRAMDAFLDWCEQSGEASSLGIDHTLAIYFSALCFDHGAKPHVASSTLSAILHFRPELSGALPRAARAASAFRALVRTPERLPFSRRTIGAIIAALFLIGEFIAAYIVAFTFAIIGRGEQDWAQLRMADVHLPRRAGDAIGVSLGVSSRGEKTKTGFDQGVVVHCPLVQAWLRERKGQEPSVGRSPRVFQMKPMRFRRLFSQACADLGLPRETPHVVRHSAATEFFAKTGSMQELMLAGRWQQAKSVKRYMKPHLVAAHEAEVRTDVLELGEAFWRDPLGYALRQRLAALERLTQ